jgi:hypothetical protein
MGTYDHGYEQMLVNIENRFGIKLSIFNSGGGWMIFEGRLETGNWLWITDWDADITPRPKRLELEAQGITVGWHIAIYSTLSGPGTAEPDSCTRLAGVEHRTAAADELIDLLELALRSLPRNEQHDFDRRGSHAVSDGVRHY